MDGRRGDCSEPEKVVRQGSERAGDRKDAKHSVETLTLFLAPPRC